MNVPVSRYAVLVVGDSLEQRRAGTVGEAAADLAVDDQRVQEPARVVDGRRSRGSAPGPCRGRPRRRRRRRGSRGTRTRRRGRRRPAARGSARRSRRSRGARAPSPAAATRGSSAPSRRPAGARARSPRWARIVADLRRELVRRGRDRTGADSREARRVVARGDCPRARRRVQLGQHLDLAGLDAEHVGDDLRRDGAVPLALRRRRDAHGDPAARGRSRSCSPRRCRTSAAQRRAPRPSAPA